MQLMSWMVARLGSRFSLLLEPYHRRVRHSALGRFLDQPTDLKIGLVEPDGAERVLPFTRHGDPLGNCEQFERFNSITYRGFSERWRLQFEFNIHSVFYPHDERLSLMPAFYMEMRINPVPRVGTVKATGPTPQSVRLFLEVDRADTRVTASAQPKGRIDLDYEVELLPQSGQDVPGLTTDGRTPRSVRVRERIVSLNEGCEATANGRGLMLDLDVRAVGQGVKWRLVWGAHCGDPMLHVGSGDALRPARLRYTQWLEDIDAVMADAVENRDARLAHSRRVEKLIDQASLTMTQRHLMSLGHQTYMSNTFWCRFDDGGDWFSVWAGSTLEQSSIWNAYTAAPWYLSFWPSLLEKQLRQWCDRHADHPASGGAYPARRLGWGLVLSEQMREHDTPLEAAADVLLLLQAYTHATGDILPATEMAERLERLAAYLLWTDREGTGFPSAGVPDATEEGGEPIQVARRQTYPAIKRLAALRAAGGLLEKVGWHDEARRYEAAAEEGARELNRHAWLDDHFAAAADRSAVGIVDARTGEALAFEDMPGWDAYSILTGDGLLLPAMIGQPLLLDRHRLAADIYNAMRECVTPYGCSRNSAQPAWISIGQNLWRDLLGQYLGMDWPPFLSQRYWDLQVAGNTNDQSRGFVDSYITDDRNFSPRGAVAVGYLLAQPRLVIDRLAPGGERITVEPVTTTPQRWPLFALADWRAGKIPICVVDVTGRISIEGETDPIIIRGRQQADVIG